MLPNKITHSIMNLGHYLNLKDGITKSIVSEMFIMHNNDCNIALSIRVAGYRYGCGYSMRAD